MTALDDLVNGIGQFRSMICHYGRSQEGESYKRQTTDGGLVEELGTDLGVFPGGI